MPCQPMTRVELHHVYFLSATQASKARLCFNATFHFSPSFRLVKFIGHIQRRFKIVKPDRLKTANPPAA